MSLVWSPGFNGVTDPDAQTYIAAVETADTEAIEGDVALAINDFVVGCKLDGIWDAIKACCILAGARTLSGALVPLKGTAPTNNNFVAADYNRETGLVGNGSTKSIDSNRADNADPQNSAHASVYVSTNDSRWNTTTSMGYIGSANTGYTSRRGIGPYNSSLYFSNRSDSASSGVGSLTGFMGSSRASSSEYSIRRGGSSDSRSVSSVAPASQTVAVFGDNVVGTIGSQTNARLSFYSIGEAIDLEKLDTRVTRLMHLITYTQTSGLPGLSTMDLDAASYIGGAYRAGATLS